MGRRAGTPTTKKVTQLVNVEEHVEGFRQAERRIAVTRHRNEEAKWVVAQVRQQQKK